MLYCSSGSFLHPLSPSSDLTFPRLLSPSSPEPLILSSLLPSVHLLYPPRPIPVPQELLPAPLPAASIARLPCCLDIWKPAHLILGLRLV